MFLAKETGKDGEKEQCSEEADDRVETVENDVHDYHDRKRDIADVLNRCEDLLPDVRKCFHDFMICLILNMGKDKARRLTVLKRKQKPAQRAGFWYRLRFPDRVKVRRDSDRSRDYHDILDDVLTLERRNHKRLPRLFREENERSERRYHVHEKKRDNDTLHSFNEEKDADDTLEHAEPYKERMKRHERNGILEKTLNQPGRRRVADDLKKAEPEKNDKEADTCGRDRNLSEESDDRSVHGADRHDFIIYPSVHFLYAQK